MTSSNRKEKENDVDLEIETEAHYLSNKIFADIERLKKQIITAIKFMTTTGKKKISREFSNM